MTPSVAPIIAMLSLMKISKLATAIAVFSGLCQSAVVFATPVQQVTTPLPNYVLTFAPLSYLYSGESWWPADVAAFVTHVTPEVNFVAVAPSVTLTNISTLTNTTFLTSNDFVEDDGGHDWLTNAANIPDASGHSPAPATIIAVNKPGGIVDAFYFYFYGFDHAAYVRLILCSVFILTSS
jgi:hypothetical protein